MLYIFQPQLLKFALVGVIGFAIDTLTFSLCFYIIELPLINARIMAFLLAATSTWLGNRMFTFSFAEKNAAFKQWQQYMLTALISAVPNIAVFKGITMLFGETQWIIYMALVCGVFVGMVSNYIINTRWVFIVKKSTF